MLAYLFVAIVSTLTTLIVQQIHRYSVDSAKYRRAARRRRVARMKEPFIESIDYRRIALTEFGSICRRLTADGADKVTLRRQGELILQELKS